MMSADDRQNLLRGLQQLPGYYKILENCTVSYHDEKAEFDIILIHESGIYAFKIFDRYRILGGSDKFNLWPVLDLSTGEEIAETNPMKILDKEQFILDARIRTVLNSRSFVYGIFPQDCGLENAQTAHKNQLLFIESAAESVLADIRRNSHAYSRPDVDRIYNILTDGHAYFDPTGMKEKKAAKKHRAIRRIAFLPAILILLIGVFRLSRTLLVLDPAETPATEASKEPDEISAIVSEASPEIKSDEKFLSGISCTIRAVEYEVQNEEVNSSPAEIDGLALDELPEGCCYIPCIELENNADEDRTVSLTIKDNETSETWEAIELQAGSVSRFIFSDFSLSSGRHKFSVFINGNLADEAIFTAYKTAVDRLLANR